MSPRTQELAVDLLDRPRENRDFLAEKLPERWDFDEAFPVSPEWKAETARRCRKLDEGTVALIPGEPVFDEVIKALG